MIIVITLVPLPGPEMLEEEPLYVNAKQYHRFVCISIRIWCFLKMNEEDSPSSLKINCFFKFMQPGY